MIRVILHPVFEKINFGQQLDIKVGQFCFIPKLFQEVGTILSIAKILNQRRIQESRCCITDYLPINVVRRDLNIDWKLNNCYHNFGEFVYRFRPSGAHQGGEIHPPSVPRYIHLGQELKKGFQC